MNYEYSRTSIIRNLDYPVLQITCFNDIHCDFGVRHLEYSVSHLEYLLQVCIRAIILRLSEYFSHPDGLESTGVRITEAVL